METIAKGKEEVLSYLEAHAIGRTGSSPGEYRLIRDNDNRLILIIAGQGFSGNVQIKAGPPSDMGNITVVQGIITKIEDARR